MFNSNEITKVWVSIVDGQVHQQNGNGIRKDYYDNDIVEYLPWSTFPVLQPNELGVGCHYLQYEYNGSPGNGICDFPCKAYTEKTCFKQPCDDCELEYGHCWKNFICLLSGS